MTTFLGVPTESSISKLCPSGLSIFSPQKKKNDARRVQNVGLGGFAKNERSWKPATLSEMILNWKSNIRYGDIMMS